MLKLLIADDEESILDGLQTLIDWGALGYELVASLRDGQSAIAYLADNPVDAVLTDILMPRGSGIDVAEYIHNSALGAHVVLLSGYRDFEAARSAMRYGVNHYITKPFLLDTLRDTMKEVAEEIARERAKRDGVKDRRQIEEMKEFMRERFFVEAASGTLRHRYAFDRWVEILHIDEADLNRQCVRYRLLWTDSIHELKRCILLDTPYEYGCAYRNGEDEVYLVLLLPLDENVARFPCDLSAKVAGALGPGSVLCVKTSMSVYDLALHHHPYNAIPSDPAIKTFSTGTGAASTACAYILEHHREKISLTDVAEHVHLSPAYLSRMFSEQTGYSFRDYLTHTRIQAAARILASTSSPVYIVCEEAGYSDIKHFYKVFRQVMGVTPTEYREMSGIRVQEDRTP